MPIRPCQVGVLTAQTPREAAVDHRLADFTRPLGRPSAPASTDGSCGFRSRQCYYTSACTNAPNIPRLGHFVLRWR